MIASRSTTVFVATVIFLATSVFATEHIVGDEKGWDYFFDYQTWVKDKVFRVGDKLVFNYATGTHNVVKVNSTNFQNCSSSSFDEMWRSGRDYVFLQTTGMQWYICDKSKHCEFDNMKLAINVQTSTSTTLMVSMMFGSLVALFSSLALFFA